MPIFNLDMRMDRIGDSLTYVKDRIKLETASGYTDLNKGAEDFYCGLMNTAFGWNLQNLNALRMDFPAIDLGDAERGICVQVTSTEGRDKVSKTLEKFFAHGLREQYNRLLVLIIGDKPIYRDPFRVESGFDFAPDRDIWDTKKLLAQIRLEGLEAAERVEDYLQRHLNLPRIPAPLLHLPAPGALPGNAFVGRKDKLAELAEKLADGSNAPILLSGLGGMGKTALVAQFRAAYTGGNVYFVRFRENFTQTVALGVAAGIPGYNERKPDGARDYAEAMELLRQCGKGDILIIDNADEPNDDFEKLQTDPAWGALRQLPVRLILTTRCDVPGAIRVKRMGNGDLHRFFVNQGLSLSAGKMDDLIEAVQGHTMMVDLMARTLKRTRTLTVEKLLAVLREGNLPGQSYRTVAVERNGEVTQEVIYDHLRRLFNVAEISEDARAVLRNMVLLPEGGMDIGILEAALGEVEFETLNQQIDQGWLTFDEETRFVSIHPVVRLVCREELKPDDENCGKFLNAVWDYYDPNQYSAERFRQFAELYSRAADILSDYDGLWAVRAGQLWRNVGQATNAIHYGKQAINRLEQNMPDSELLALTYALLGYSYDILGDAQDGQKYHQKALEYYVKILEIRENEMPAEHLDLAPYYSRVAIAYGDLGNHIMEQEYYLKALKLLEQASHVDQIALAESYDSVGSTYGYLGDHETELEYRLKALAIWEQVLPEDHLNMAQAYDGIGSSYGAQGDHGKALENKLKALEIRKKVLSSDHLVLAKSYGSVGEAYGSLNEYEQELIYHLKALEIREKVLPPKHPDLAESYGNLGFTYYYSKNYTAALENMKKALSIAEQSLLEGNPHIQIYRRGVELFEEIITLLNKHGDAKTQ